MKCLLTALLSMCASYTCAQHTDTLWVDVDDEQQIDELTVTARKAGTNRLSGAENTIRINREELFRAACCNLGESFTTNPSVDVSYSDAATGAKQIRLLGLSGTYVQLLTENLPNYRGALLPYSLDYVPGPWMQSIHVSKGASSVRNGYEGITGQIDVEYLKPDGEEGATFNVYGNTLSRLELNADASKRINKKLSTEILAHYQDDYAHHDENHDGFLDQPNVRQLNMQNRWKWMGTRYIFHGGIGMVHEERSSGQTHHTAPHVNNPYSIGITTNHYEGYMKHAYVIDPEHGTNIALMGNLSMQKLNADYGHKHYGVTEKNAYAQLMFESNITPRHNLSAGLSLSHVNLDQSATYAGLATPKEMETTPGIYAQYTYNLDSKLIAMVGVRADHSSLYGNFLTPRLHLKLKPTEAVSLRLSAGKGYRTAHPLAENNNLMASGRQLIVDNLEQEEAWNYGITASFDIPLLGNTLRLNAEYYHTRFLHQTLIDYDTNPTQIHITNLSGKSYSNTLQVDATYPIVTGLDLTVAYRWNDVKTTYGQQLMEKPLVSRYKGLLTLSYKTPLGKWQFDATLQLNGSGRMPTPYTLPDGTPSWQARYSAFEQLSAQVTRWFRHFSVYIGGENLTGMRQHQTIINAANPWSSTFEPTLIWGPVHGALAYAGIRINLGRL